ncbi:MAG TPA: hypothetical protein VF065_19220, partial [Ilumatobacter sp.]
MSGRPAPSFADRSLPHLDDHTVSGLLDHAGIPAVAAGSASAAVADAGCATVVCDDVVGSRVECG